MKKQYLFLVFITLILCSRVSYAQLVGANCYLKGHWLEIGIVGNGALGAPAPPVGYHPHNGGPGVTPGAPLAEVYDYGHDGWTVGSPPFMGDYTYPGSPFEGWEVQANGSRCQAYQGTGSGFSYSGPGTMTGGTMSSYSNVGGVIKGFQTGTYNPGGASLLIKQESRVDTNANAVVFTTKFYNTGAGIINNVYYWRSCDPDNDQTWPGGGFPTNNVINYQNDIAHRVQVTATGSSSTLPPMSLCTKDCRAVACIYNSWGLSVGSDLATGWAMNTSFGGGSFFNIGVNHPGDIGIGIIFKVGNIAVGDSAVTSCAYVFNGSTGLDSVGAFPEPALAIGGSVAVAPAPYPGVVIDTYNACAHPGLTAVPVDVLYGDEKAWTWSTWTWSPSLGLASTTGVHNIIYTTVLPPSITYTITGVDAATCQTRTMLLTIVSCNNVRANEPCYGDTLFLRRVGDSTGCTYFWYGPAGYTSTQQNPFIYPATYADSTKFFVVRTLAGVHDTDSIAAVVHHTPVITVSNNGPLCQGGTDTMRLTCGPGMLGMTYAWNGPPAFTSSLQNPTISPFVDVDTGNYRVIVTSPYGCKDTGVTRARVIIRPSPPNIINRDFYCQGEVYAPYTVTGVNPGATVYWWSVAVGGTSSLVPPVFTTAVPGTYVIWASQKDGNCESLRDIDTVRVVTTPLAPVVTGVQDYCQYIGPIVPLTVTPSDSAKWYTASIGGAPAYIAPIPNINVPGTTNFWVSRIDSGCEGPRTPTSYTIHAKPAPPVVTQTPWCQYRTPGPIQVAPSGAGDVLTYYGPGVTGGYPTAPTPSSSVAPDTIFYYITETTVPWGCISDSAIDKVVIKVKPQPPVTHDIRYCQHDFARPMNERVDSEFHSHLNWYFNSIPLPPTPKPYTDTVPGFTTYWVSQTVPNDATGCESDSAALKVEVVYKPDFIIESEKPWVCQFDSLHMAYKGPALFEPGYNWTLPVGAYFANNSNAGDSMITVRFDSTHQNNYITLRASNDSGFCYSDAQIRIKVVPQPTMIAYTKPDVCLGDTVALSLATRADDAYTYKWFIDNVIMDASTALNVLTSNSNTGGPFSISWVDSGRHVIKITSSSVEGCKSMPTYDTVLVHTGPDATFKITSHHDHGICLEDSVEFSATINNLNYSYVWGPEHDFNNLNQSIAWGKMEEVKNVITLKVTDPYGCYATAKLDVDAGSCCLIAFPNAFTPNGSGPEENNVFKPYVAGYHRFHMFRILNRWGQTIFESANSSVMGWDGKFNGVPQEMGVYYYILKYDCGGKSLEQKGDVTLIR